MDKPGKSQRNSHWSQDSPNWSLFWLLGGHASLRLWNLEYDLPNPKNRQTFKKERLVFQALFLGGYMLVFGVYVHSKKLDYDGMISKFGHHHPPYLRACIVGKLSFFLRPFPPKMSRGLWNSRHEGGTWVQDFGIGPCDTGHNFFTWKVPPTRWFKVIFSSPNWRSPTTP